MWHFVVENPMIWAVVAAVLAFVIGFLCGVGFTNFDLVNEEDDRPTVEMNVYQVQLLNSLVQGEHATTVVAIQDRWNGSQWAHDRWGDVACGIFMWIPAEVATGESGEVRLPEGPADDAEIELYETSHV